MKCSRYSGEEVVFVFREEKSCLKCPNSLMMLMEKCLKIFKGPFPKNDRLPHHFSSNIRNFDTRLIISPSEGVFRNYRCFKIFKFQILLMDNLETPEILKNAFGRLSYIGVELSQNFKILRGAGFLEEDI